MKKETPQQFLAKANKEALAAVPTQDAATAALEESIVQRREAIAAARSERKDVHSKRKQGVAFNSKIKKQ